MTIKGLNEHDIEEWLENEKVLSEQVQILKGHIVINVSYEYNIPLENCSTYKDILHWAWHLTEKPWMSQELTRKFIEVACEAHGLEYR